MKVYEKITDLIGGTPLLKLTNYQKEKELGADILAKLEYLNPAGSVKDRIAYAMITDAEEKGLLKPGAVIIEPTSGNTGIGLAAGLNPQVLELLRLHPSYPLLHRSHQGHDHFAPQNSPSDRVRFPNSGHTPW